MQKEKFIIPQSNLVISIFRTSLGVNVDAIIVPNKHSCRLTNTVREVSKGATEVIPMISVSNLAKVTKFLIQNAIIRAGRHEHG